MSAHASSQMHDTIKLSSFNRQGIILKLAEFKAMGMSQSWIARELKVSEAWVHFAWKRDKKRNSLATDGAQVKNKCAIRARAGAAPFGFEVLDCRLVENPREMRTVQKIIELWNAGYGRFDISKELNRSKLKTRKGKAGSHCLVSSIVLRAQAGDPSYAKFSANLRPYRARKSPERSGKNSQMSEKPNQKQV